MSHSAICTLFEGDYHVGVGALLNSLHKNGFRGDFWVGFRGSLPPWARGTEERDGRFIFRVSDDCQIRFVPLDTKSHLSNFKPEFMQRVLELAPPLEAIYYFDPDITVTAPWSFFEEWVRCGIALCEDVNSPLYENHPRRVAWKRHYASHLLPLNYRGPQYANSGFIGIAQCDFAFLETWRKTQTLMAPLIGGLEKSIFPNALLSSDRLHPLFPFSRPDQDALNAAVEATSRSVSILGKEAMGFTPGGIVMPHALGAGKPWRRNYLREALAGRPPNRSDRAFWEHALSPIPAVGRGARRRARLSLTISAAIGRFIQRT